MTIIPLGSPCATRQCCISVLVVFGFLLGSAAVYHAHAQELGSGVRPNDLVVYGGTPAVIVAAIAATREGASAIVIAPSAHIGGMVTGGLSCTDTDAPATIGGIAREFFTRADAKYYGA